ALRGLWCRSGARSAPHPARWRGDAGVRQSRRNRVRDRRFFPSVRMRGSDQPLAILELVPRLRLGGLRLPGLLRPPRMALQRPRFILRTDRRPAHATLTTSVDISGAPPMPPLHCPGIEWVRAFAAAPDRGARALPVPRRHQLDDGDDADDRGYPCRAGQHARAGLAAVRPGVLPAGLRDLRRMRLG